ncbi:MAG: hypothetical protein ABIX19_04435 [Gemmatimonadaceae bacterium]
MPSYQKFAGALLLVLLLVACGGDATMPTNDTVGPPANFTVIWKGASAPAGSRVTGPSVAITDAAGHAIRNATVTFVITTGGGILIDSADKTDADGVASAGTWQLGPLVGTQAMTATSSGFPVWTIIATATAP